MNVWGQRFACRVEDEHDNDFNTWFRTEKFEQIPAEKAKVATFLGINPEDFSFVENATRGKYMNVLGHESAL